MASAITTKASNGIKTPPELVITQMPSTPTDADREQFMMELFDQALNEEEMNILKSNPLSRKQSLELFERIRESQYEKVKKEDLKDKLRKMDMKLVRKATIEALEQNILSPGKKENLVDRVMINEQITQVKGQDASKVAEQANNITRRSISHA